MVGKDSGTVFGEIEDHTLFKAHTVCSKKKLLIETLWHRVSIKIQIVKQSNERMKLAKTNTGN